VSCNQSGPFFYWSNQRAKIEEHARLVEHLRYHSSISRMLVSQAAEDMIKFVNANQVWLSPLSTSAWSTHQLTIWRSFQNCPVSSYLS